MMIKFGELSSMYFFLKYIFHFYFKSDWYIFGSDQKDVFG